MSGDRVNVRLWKYCWGGEEPFCSSFIVYLDCPVCGILRLMDWDCGFQRNLNEEERREGKSVVVRKTILFWKNNVNVRQLQSLLCVLLCMFVIVTINVVIKGYILLKYLICYYVSVRIC